MRTFFMFAVLGLNAAEFATCIDTGAQASEIAADLAAGSESGVSGTQGIWILAPDGQSQYISGAYPYETFPAAFDGMID